MFLCVCKNGRLASGQFLAGTTFRAAVLPFVFSFLLALVVSARAHAAVGVVLNESLDESMDRITGSGHTAVYFSGICADSPIKLRLCRPGELGSVMSTYINIGEDRSFEWNIVPLSIYLYGVEDPRNRPIFGSFKIKHALEERYRELYLNGYCASESCRTSGKSEWREMVAATLIRGVYIFAVDTSEEQDRKLIAEFDDAANKNHFNGATHNCADFVRQIIDTYFRHAVSRDFLNDFGMTSPKAVARTFTRYSQRHPECNFRVVHFAQVPGTIKRSSEVRAGTEQLFRSKKLLIPMLIFADHELPVVAASYIFMGRFNPEKEFERYPNAEPSPDGPAAKSGRDAAALCQARMQIVGTPLEWKNYRGAFDSLAQENTGVLGSKELSHFFKHLDEAGTVSLDSDGAAWMDLAENGVISRVGVSASTTLSSASDPELSYKLFLARTGTFLKSPKHRRETMLEFQQDWASLQHVSAELATISAASSDPTKSAHVLLTPGDAKE